MNDSKQNKSPLISIITVVYNAAETLERTMLSVLNQTYSNIEYIIIDGGSTDTSLDIIQKYDEKLEYYLSEPDDGIYNAMNKGISLAKGDYICLLNADDYYSEDFVFESVQAALDTQADIIYSDLFMFNKEIYADTINEGIYIHYLGLNHSTFLVSKSAYNKIGPYREDYKIVSDAIWMRSAFKNGIKFSHLQKSMFYFSEGGLSSGNDEKRRQLFISEVGRSYREIFNFLTQEEAEKLYLSRFNLNSIHTILELINRYAEYETLFVNSLKKYMQFILLNKFVFKKDDIKNYLDQYLLLCNRLRIPYSTLKITDTTIDTNNIMDQIDNSSEKANRESDKKIILHFVSNFSSPSETFIYDLIQRLEKSSEYINIILCDKRLLVDERPYDKCIHIDWENTTVTIRELLYLHLFDTLKPDVIIAHFAINGWKLHQRINPLNIKKPMVNMTHGIDVFSISNNEAYREYILNYASIDPITIFTTVSNYLFNELTDRGVPSNKINIVPNVIHDRFFEHRKISNFYNKSRELKILNIGRLITLKGHNELIDGINYYINNVSKNIHLTIIYGHSSDNIYMIKEKIKNLGLLSYVSLIDFIDFNNNPDYYSYFDLYICSSKYSEDTFRRSETFGMSTLEAIAAGLPVIVTDAGGSSEVVGNETIFSKIVPHSNGIAIGKAIEEFVKEDKCFKNNIDYAKERLQKFNSTLQIQHLSSIISNLTNEKLKVTIITSIIHGGAGKAATRVHKSLLMNNVDSTIVTRNNAVVATEPSYTYLNPEINFEWDAIQSNEYIKKGYTIFSLNEPTITRETLARIVEKTDIINIHWTARFLTAEDIGYLSNLGKPLVITVRDMHPLTGGCHFFHGCDKWKKTCYSCPQLIGDDAHFPKKVLSIKKSYWNMNNITFIALSEHTNKIIQKSAFYANNKIEVIGNPIDLNIFSPIEKNKARAFFNINVNTPLLFYVPSYGSIIKGSYEFKKALHVIKEKYPDFKLTLLMAGSATVLNEASEYLYPVIHLGSFSNDKLLAKAYSCADATIIPSLEETFSNTAAESVACGTPIVGFKTGAIPEISDNGRGESVEVGNIEALAESIYKVLNLDNTKTSDNCHNYAKEQFSFVKQGKKYTALFNSLRSTRIKTPKINPKNIPIIDESVYLDICHWKYKKNVIKKLSVPDSTKIDNKHNSTSSTSIKNLKKLYTANKLHSNFNNLCSISIFKNPIQKIIFYKQLLLFLHSIKNDEIKYFIGHEELLESFNQLCRINTKKEPLKKISSYKKLILSWHDFKRFIDQ